MRNVARSGFRVAGTRGGNGTNSRARRAATLNSARSSGS